MKMQSVLTVAALVAGAMLTAADIQLPKPQISGGAPLLTTLARRSTNRNMDGKALSCVDFLNTVLSYGAPHHYVICPGHMEAVAREFAVRQGLTLVKPEPYTDGLR